VEEDVVLASASALGLGGGLGHPRRGGVPRHHPLRPRLGRDLHASTEHTHPLPLASFRSPSIFVSSIQLRMFSICSCLAMSHMLYFGFPVDGAVEERGNYEFLNWALLDLGNWG
jgi:hypothetical protein